MKVVTKIVTFNEPNRTGYVYSADVIKQTIDKLPNNEVYVVLGESCEKDYTSAVTVDLNDICGVAKLSVDENSLMGDIKILRTPKGNILSSLIDNGVGIEYGLRGYGYINANNEVSDLNIVSINVMLPTGAPLRQNNINDEEDHIVRGYN